MVGQGHGLASPLRDMPPERHVSVEVNAQPSERWLLATVFSLGDGVNSEAVADYHGWVRGVLGGPGDVLKLALFRCKENLVVVAPFQDRSYVLSKEPDVGVEGWRRPVQAEVIGVAEAQVLVLFKQLGQVQHVQDGREGGALRCAVAGSDVTCGGLLESDPDSSVRKKGIHQSEYFQGPALAPYALKQPSL